MQVKKLINGQTLIICGLHRYRVDTIMDDGVISYNLLREKNLQNNPTGKIRHRFIKNFNNFNEVLNFIQRKNNYILNKKAM